MNISGSADAILLSYNTRHLLDGRMTKRASDNNNNKHDNLFTENKYLLELSVFTNKGRDLWMDSVVHQELPKQQETAIHLFSRERRSGSWSITLRHEWLMVISLIISGYQTIHGPGWLNVWMTWMMMMVVNNNNIRQKLNPLYSRCCCNSNALNKYFDQISNLFSYRRYGGVKRKLQGEFGQKLIEMNGLFTCWG